MRNYDCLGSRFFGSFCRTSAQALSVSLLVLLTSRPLLKYLPCPFTHQNSHSLAALSVLLCFPVLLPAMNSTLRESVLRAQVGKTAPQRNLLSGHLVLLFVKVNAGTKFAGIPTLMASCNFGEIFLRRKLHKHNLPYREKLSRIFIGAPKRQTRCKTCFYPYSFHTSAKVRKTVSNFYPSSFYACNSRPVRSVSPWPDTGMETSTTSHFFVVKNVESSSREVPGAPINDEVARGNINVRPFDSQVYRQKEVWLTIFRVSSV